VLKYILRRLLVLPLIMFLVTMILFLLILQIPVEQRAQVYLASGNPNATPEQLAHKLQVTIEKYGLDKPWPVQYTHWLENVIKGDWGYSPSWRQPVLEGLLRRTPATIELTLFAMVPAFILAIVLGSLAAGRRNRIPDHVVRAAAFVGWAFPPFILAFILINVFYAWTGWFPPERLSIWASLVVNSEDFHTYTGFLTVDALLNSNLPIFWDAIRHMVLPGISLALVEWALLMRIMRSSLLDVLNQDYITTARAKGVHERQVLRYHARRNAILPVISAGSVVTSMLITWIVVIEVVFGYNGVGRGAFEAIANLEIQVAVGFAILSCMAVVLASLIADVLYAVVDPRIRLFGNGRHDLG
jgi:ABC-type dipeptide/oligopeptide/nickel transport system permease component